ncbi:DUF433 domain-containing protein [Salinarimonas ramus]|uniref:DUF433 domain-containing protein n=1 Tax=Salinarimonas ramus TaxID=690164 RepID=A0A917QE12_9HYPH|nr:DUF433 domain-containing protein [Salinarimonas ramus]GGK46066.1 hypothetical protein GCM10011322_36460 [Salinarimonas ramus]
MSKNWIERNGAVHGGVPVIRGTRTTVYSVLARVNRGETLDELVKENPDIPRAAFEAAVTFARAYTVEHPTSFSDALMSEGFEPTQIRLVIAPERAAPRPRLWQPDGVPKVDPIRQDRSLTGPHNDISE